MALPTALVAGLMLWRVWRKKQCKTNSPCPIVLQYSSHLAVIKAATKAILSTMQNVTEPRILLPTGTTPLLLYQHLFQLLNNNTNDDKLIDFTDVSIVSGDEYYGIEMENKGSFATYFKEKIIKPLKIDYKKVLLLNGGSQEIEKECEEYEKNLRHKNCDLAILGLGTNGHVAFNDPPSSKDSRTRMLNLTKESIQTAQGDFPDLPYDQLPTQAVTIGLGTLREYSKQILVLVTGQKKAKILKEVIEGVPSPNVPASLLRDAPQILFLADREATSLLSPQSFRVMRD